MKSPRAASEFLRCGKTKTPRFRSDQIAQRIGGIVPAETFFDGIRAGQSVMSPILEAAAVEQATMSYQLQASVGVYRAEIRGGNRIEHVDRHWVPWGRTLL